MRIATSYLYKNATNELQRQQSELARTQQQISSGKRILKPSDDPVGTSRSLGISESIQQLKQYHKNAIFAEQRLSLEETTLESATNLLQRVKELALASKSGVQTVETRAAYRIEVEQRMQELLAYANTRDANGDYIFAGFKGDTLPFTETAAGVAYNGDHGQQLLQIGATRQVASGDSGADVFQRIRNGNGTFTAGGSGTNTGTGNIAAGSVVDASVYQFDNFTIRFTSATSYDVVNDTTATTVLAAQPYVENGVIAFNGIETSINGVPVSGDEFTVKPSRNQDVFTSLKQFIAAMDIDPANASEQAQLNQSMNTVVGDIDQALGHLLEVRVAVGARLNSVDTTRAENESVQLQLQETLSEVQDLDYPEAISRLQFQMTTLQALQQTFTRVEELSLFNYLR